MNLLVTRFKDRKPHPPGQTGCWALDHFEPSPMWKVFAGRFIPRNGQQYFFIASTEVTRIHSRAEYIS